MLHIENLTKRFYHTVALDEITLTIPSGEIIGVLGPNGAGKTTLFKVVVGVLQPDKGGIVVKNGRFPRIGYKPERLYFPERMTNIQYLRMMANLCSVPAGRQEESIRQVLAQVGLTGSANKKIGRGSKGMRQRLGLAQALLGDPDLLVLDEPSDGLDPSGQEELHIMIRALRSMGKTILMSSHQLGEVTSVCSEVAILHQGRLIYRNRMAEALAERPRTTIHVDRPLAPIRPLLETLNGDIMVGEQTIGLRGGAVEHRRQILSIILAAGFDVLQIERRRSSLAEIYAEVTRS